MHLLVIENIQGTLKATPVIEGKLNPKAFCEFWNEDDLKTFVDAFQDSPYNALFAYECEKQRQLLREAAGLYN